MKKALFIINPISGGRGKTRVIEVIKNHLDYSKLSPEFKFTEAPGEAVFSAHNSDADIVIAVGGDGTVHEVAMGLLGTDKSLGIIPCGSGNGLALHLGISLDPRKAVDVLNEGKCEKIDYGTINGAPFFVTVGIGFDALVAWKFAEGRKRGLINYVKSVALAWRHYSPETYRISVGDYSLSKKSLLVTVGNANQWGNNAKITPKASVQDGMLDLAIVAPVSIWRIPVMLAKLFDGRASTASKVSYYEAQKIVILRNDSGYAHVDGEPILLGRELVINVVPSALSAIVPRTI